MGFRVRFRVRFRVGFRVRFRVRVRVKMLRVTTFTFVFCIRVQP